MRCKRCDKWYPSFLLSNKRLCKSCEKIVERQEGVLSNRSTSRSSRRNDDDSFLPISPTFDYNASAAHRSSDFEPGGGSFGGGGSSGSWDSGSSDCGSCGGSD